MVQCAKKYGFVSLWIMMFILKKRTGKQSLVFSVIIKNNVTFLYRMFIYFMSLWSSFKHRDFTLPGAEIVHIILQLACDIS